MEFISATSKAEALSVLGRFGSDAAPLAGGTDLMVQIARQERRPAAVVHIERLAELRGLDMSAGRAHIGALVTQKTLTDRLAGSPYAGLALAASLSGGWQTQNVGTVGGNVCNASPAADLVPPLLAHGARVRLESAEGARSLPLAEFILGRRRTARAPDELVIGFELDPAGPLEADIFEKVGRRGAMEIAIASVAVRVRLGADGRTLDDARIAIGAMGPVPFRAHAAEAVLIGRPLDAAGLREASAALLAAASPITDTRGSADYRRAVVPRVFERVLRACIAAAASRPA